MFIDTKFEKAVYNLNEIPVVQKPLIILCGRSNVGKSSFINSISNRKNLAKISSAPGKTRSINYYNIDNKFYFVDLPGYGYAKASKTERIKWAELISGFLEKVNNIGIAIHILDCRHKPTELDIRLNKLLKYKNIPPLFLLNKADKLKQKDYSQAYNTLRTIFPESVIYQNTYFYSSQKGSLKKPVIKFLEKFFDQ